MRIYQAYKGQLKIHEVVGGWIIGVKYGSIGGTTVHNFIHNDSYVFVVYPTLEAAKEAAKTIMEWRKAPITKRIEIK